MHLVVLLLALFALQGPTPTPGVTRQPPQQQSPTSQQSATQDQRGTEQSPLAIKILPTPKTAEETEQEAQDRSNKSSSDWWTIRFTGALTLIAFLQLLVYGYQAKKLRETVESAESQSEAMDRHIAEAARSAKAMEEVVSAINFGNRKSLRAYLTVVIGSGLFQQREAERQSQGDVKFEGKPQLVNTGNTPARNVIIRTAAEILPSPIPKDFGFRLPDLDPDTEGAVVGPRHQYALSGMVSEMVPDEEVGEIKRGTTRVLCVWGVITYDDIFGESHTTRFAQALTWWPNGTIIGYYIAGQNDSD